MPQLFIQLLFIFVMLLLFIFVYYYVVVYYYYIDKKVNDMDIENRITHKHMKRLRKKLNGIKI